MDAEGSTVGTGDIRAQTRQVLDNVVAVLEAAGASLEDVVYNTIFIKSLNDYAGMNEVYKAYFPSEPPARSSVFSHSKRARRGGITKPWPRYSSAFHAAGQRCLANSVCVAVGEAYEPLKERLAEKGGAMVVGDGSDEATEVGPVISPDAHERILGWIEKGIEEGRAEQELAAQEVFKNYMNAPSNHFLRR
jgi:enamine deaminase RidA (YjgF/YER057c/UK114 family)